MPFTSIQNNLCSITVLIFKIKTQRICNDCKVQHQVPSVKWPLPLFVHTINKGTSDSLLANEFWMVFCLQNFLQSSWHLILASWNWHFILQKKSMKCVLPITKIYDTFSSDQWASFSPFFLPELSRDTSFVLGQDYCTRTGVKVSTVAWPQTIPKRFWFLYRHSCEAWKMESFRSVIEGKVSTERSLFWKLISSTQTLHSHDIIEGLL